MRCAACVRCAGKCARWLPERRAMHSGCIDRFASARCQDGEAGESAPLTRVLHTPAKAVSDREAGGSFARLAVVAEPGLRRVHRLAAGSAHLGAGSDICG